jgi:hypothetical protein
VPVFSLDGLNPEGRLVYSNPVEAALDTIANGRKQVYVNIAALGSLG